jgi:hypothetical protein
LISLLVSDLDQCGGSVPSIPVAVLGLGYDFLFKSLLGHCDTGKGKKKISVHLLDKSMGCPTKGHFRSKNALLVVMSSS